MDSEDTLYIVIPAYNESENIKQVVRDWYPIVEKYGNGKSRLIVIDDGSKDNTYAILKQLSEKHPQLITLTRANGGHGATILYGYNYALEKHADYIFQTDSDGQTLPEEFDSFWEQRKNYDLIIGHRNSRKDGLSRVIVTRVLRRVIKLCFGVWVLDANTPFRLMSAKSLKQNIKYVPKDFNLSNVILSVIYTKRGNKIKFIPITFRPRQGGVNSINIKKIFSIGKQALRDFRKINNSIKELSHV